MSFFEFKTRREGLLYDGCADIIDGTIGSLRLKSGGEEVNLTRVSDALALQGYTMHLEQLDNGDTIITCEFRGVGKAPLGVVHARNIDEATGEFMKYKDELRKKLQS